MTLRTTYSVQQSSGDGAAVSTGSVFIASTNSLACLHAMHYDGSFSI